MKTTKRGNTLSKTSGLYDKEGTVNPIARFLYRKFKSDLYELIARCSISNALEIGCGYGDIIGYVGTKFDIELQGVDIEEEIIGEAVELYPNVLFHHGDGQSLAFRDNSFDLVLVIEVLEHIENVEKLIIEAKRVARKHLIFSVPREPLFQILNFTRGAHVFALGNAPGHINHWNSGEFVELLSTYFKIRDIKRPIPWTMVSCEIK